MGEDPKYVFNTGSLDVELASASTTAITNERINGYGVGHAVDVTQPFLIVIQHPVTTERDNRRHLEETLRAVSALGMPTIWIWPNPDAGTGEMAEACAISASTRAAQAEKMRFITNVPVDEFIALLKGDRVSGRQFVGRHQGVLVSRHAGRQHRRAAAGPAARRQRRACGYDSDAIRAAVRTQMAHGRYPPSQIYYRPDASQTIVDLLARSSSTPRSGSRRCRHDPSEPQGDPERRRGTTVRT